jgi:hypothetical protein
MLNTLTREHDGAYARKEAASRVMVASRPEVGFGPDSSTGPGNYSWAPVSTTFSNLPVLQTDNGAHTASYPIGTGGSFPRGKADMKLSTHLQPAPR